jgi:FixJ family two-component response regulator
MRSISAAKEETQAPDRLAEPIVDKPNNPSASSDFDFHEGVNQVLAEVGMSVADSDGQLTFHGQDPIVPRRIPIAPLSLGRRSSSACSEGGIHVTANELVYIVDDEASVGEALSTLLRANGKQVQLFTSGEDFLDFGRRDSCACPEESHLEFPPTDGRSRSGFRRQYSGLRDRKPSCWDRLIARSRTNARFPIVSDVQEIPNAIPLCACLILDLNMPGLGGLEVQKMISAKTSIPVIFLTGRGDIPSTVRAMKGGAVDFLTKPVDEEALLASVERALRQDRASRQKAVEHARLVARYESLTPREREVLPLLAAGFAEKAGGLRVGDHRIHRPNPSWAHNAKDGGRLFCDTGQACRQAQARDDQRI